MDNMFSHVEGSHNLNKGRMCFTYMRLLGGYMCSDHFYLNLDINIQKYRKIPMFIF